MSDTTKTEFIAEDLVSHSLQLHGLFVAKPKFDQLGADLLAFADFVKSNQFGVIQSKGRDVTASKSNVEIPNDYVREGFAVFLVVLSKEKAHQFLFIGKEISEGPWAKAVVENKEIWRLSIPQESFMDKLEAFKFGDTRAKQLKSAIETADRSKLFNYFFHGSGEIKFPGITVTGKGTYTPP